MSPRHYILELTHTILNAHQSSVPIPFFDCSGIPPRRFPFLLNSDLTMRISTINPVPGACTFCHSFPFLLFICMLFLYLCALRNREEAKFGQWCQIILPVHARCWAKLLRKVVTVLSFPETSCWLLWERGYWIRWAFGRIQQGSSYAETVYSSGSEAWLLHAADRGGKEGQAHRFKWPEPKVQGVFLDLCFCFFPGRCVK